MEVVVNGEKREFEGEMKVVEMLKALGIEPGMPGIAVAVNLSVVRKGEWENVLGKNGDEVDVITARQGG